MIDEKTLSYLKKDTTLKQIIDSHSLPTIYPSKNLLESLVKSIISQQLSVKASDTIFNRFLSIYNNKFPDTKKLLATDVTVLRNVGISYSKIDYIKGISERIEADKINFEYLINLSDEQVINELIKFKGVGRWTAEMILMFDLSRPDIFSIGDLGLRTAVSKLYNVDRNNHEKILKITQVWSPYRTTASRYLWQSLNNSPK